MKAHIPCILCTAFALTVTGTSWSQSVLMAQSMGQPSPATQQQQSPGVNRPGSDSALESAAGGGSGRTMIDKLFLRKATQGDLMEIEAGKLAEDKGSADDVKHFGARMQKDHAVMEERLKPLFDQYGVQPATKLDKEHQAMLDHLDTLSGEAFDKEYVQAMVKDHHTDLRDFERERDGTDNTQLKAAVSDGTKVIARHTDWADRMALQRGIARPTM